MKVGDLVELSAYGLKCSGWATWMDGLLGIVVAHSSDYRPQSDWRVRWYQNGREVYLGRKYLKHARVKK